MSSMRCNVIRIPCNACVVNLFDKHIVANSVREQVLQVCTNIVFEWNQQNTSKRVTQHILNQPTVGWVQGWSNQPVCRLQENNTVKKFNLFIFQSSASFVTHFSHCYNHNMTDLNICSTANLYNSLTRFELASFIFDTSLSPKTIIDAVIDSSNKKTFRSMIYDGICKYYEKHKDFGFVQNIRDKLMVKKKCSNGKDTKDDLKIGRTNMNEFFSVDDLICKTMQYLDFKSLISCRLINKSFLYLTYNTSSTRYLNIIDLFDIDNPKNVSELLRFKQISNIEVAVWEQKFNNLFKYLSTFRKLSNITVNCPVSNNGCLDRFGQFCVEMIKNNNDNISSIRLTSDTYGNRDIPIQMTNRLTLCKNLHELEISNVRLCNVTDSTNNSNYNDNNKLVNLEKLTLKNISVDLSLFRSLLQLNMLKLEELILHDIDITVNSKKIDDNMKVDIDITNPNFQNIKHLTLGKSNGNWHDRLLNNLTDKTKKIQSGSKLESLELSVCQMSKKQTTILHNSGTRFDRMKKLVIISLQEDNSQNSICNALDRVGYLTKLKMDNISSNTDYDHDKLYTSDIETLGIEYDVGGYNGFGIIDSIEILNKIKFTKLKSIIFYMKRYFNFYERVLGFESDCLDDLLFRINTIDQFFDNNGFECIKMKKRDYYGHTRDESCKTLCCYRVLYGSADTFCHKASSEIDGILNKKNKWDQIGNIVSKWCNCKNKDIKKYDDDDCKLGLTLQFRAWLNLDSNVKINGNTLCAKVKWINTMINSLSMSENPIDFGDMITKNVRSVDNSLSSYGCTESKFDIQLNNCISINGTIKEKNECCYFELCVLIKLL